MRIGAVGLMSLLVLAACSGEGGPSSNSASMSRSPQSSSAHAASPRELSCADVIDDATELPADYEAIVDGVGLPTSDSARRALQVTAQSGDSVTPRFFAKTGLVVRSGVAFTIRVNHPPRIALIGWGSPPDFGSELHSGGCGGNAWLAFAGGLVVSEPMCVHLMVTVNDERDAVRIGVGAPCEGQRPPLTI